jgi:tripartite-type tricarboxylate transporter receptor subunit TctC
LPFDAARDFVPVSLLESSPIVLVVNPSVPANTLPELIAWAKTHPGMLTFGSNGSGSPEHIAGELFNQTAHVDIRHVSFDGAGPARKQVLQGGVSMMFDPCKAAIVAIQSGKLRALGVAGPSRLAELPDVPTFAEAGIDGFDLRIWTGILVPSGTPSAVVGTLNRAIQDALLTPEVEKEIAHEGGQSGRTSPEQFADYIRNERAKWRNLAIETGVRNISGPM